MAEDRYRLADVDTYALDQGAYLAYIRPSRTAQLLTEAERDLLLGASCFETLEGHARRWLQRQALAALPDPPQDARRGWLSGVVGRLEGYARSQPHPVGASELRETVGQLESLRQRGLLLSEAGWLRSCRAHAAEPPPPAGISTLGIATRNRPETLERGLASYIANARKHGHAIDFLVVDDSDDPDLAARNREVTSKLAAAHGATIRYAGDREREAFVDVLSLTSGAPRPVVEFALRGGAPCSNTTGAAYNCLLLDTIGDCLVVADDDTICQLAEIPGREPGLRLTSVQDPTRMWFFADRSSVSASVDFAGRDFFGLHQEVLGKPVPHLLPAETGGSLDLNPVSATVLRRAAGRGGRIVLSSAGIAGDSGIDMTAYLYVDGESRDRLTSSEETYLAAVESRQLMRAVTRTTVGAGRFLMAGNLGMDNRGLLPPFLPVQRNIEGVFAITLRKLFHDDYLGFLPWVVRHESPAGRTQSLKDFFTRCAQLRFSDILGQLIESAPGISQTATRPEAIKHLGRYLTQTGSRNPGEFGEMVRHQFFALFGEKLREQEDLRADERVPEFYARYRKRYKDQLREALASLRYFQPRDLLEVADEESIRWLVPRLVRQYGDLLTSWPAMVESARKLREQGIRVAVEP